MSRTQPMAISHSEAVPRSEAIAILRNELLKITDDENSLCKVAAERGIFCQGFRHHSEGGLRRCYSWLDSRRPGMSRSELEELANIWQLARQEVDQLPLACDVQQKEHDTCGGWDDFSNDELASVYLEITGNDLVVV